VQSRNGVFIKTELESCTGSVENQDNVLLLFSIMYYFEHNVAGFLIPLPQEDRNTVL